MVSRLSLEPVKNCNIGAGEMAFSVGHLCYKCKNLSLVSRVQNQGSGVGGARHGSTCLKGRAEERDKEIPRAHWPISLDKSASSCPVRDSVSKTRQEPRR